MNVFELPAHPAAELLPMLSDDELAQLADDIRVNGQHDPVLVWTDSDEQSWLLDGRNRREACKLAHVEPRFVVKSVAQIPDPQAFVLGKNVLRRNLTQAQRAMAIVMLGDKNLSVRKLAEESGTSREYVRQAKLIHEADQKLATKVLRNERPIYEAFQSIDGDLTPRPKLTEEQQRVAEQVKIAHKNAPKNDSSRRPEEHQSNDDADFHRTINAFGMLASVKTDAYSIVLKHGDPWKWRYFKKAKTFIDDLLDSVD